MTQSPLERAARALAKSNTGHEGNWREWLDDARAVLMAVRESSEAMAISGRAVLPEHDEPLQEDAINCWQAMIDAVLEEG